MCIRDRYIGVPWVVCRHSVWDVCSYFAWQETVCLLSLFGFCVSEHVHVEHPSIHRMRTFWTLFTFGIVINIAERRVLCMYVCMCVWRRECFYLGASSTLVLSMSSTINASPHSSWVVSTVDFPPRSRICKSWMYRGCFSKVGLNTSGLCQRCRAEVTRATLLAKSLDVFTAAFFRPSTLCEYIATPNYPEMLLLPICFDCSDTNG